MKTASDTLIKAMRILSHEIKSDDGVANAAIAEAADRLYELEVDNAAYRKTLKEMQTELIEEARLNGKGSEREAALLAKVEKLEKENKALEEYFNLKYK